MRSRVLTILGLALLPLALSGCSLFGGKKPIKEGFWWDDQRRQRLDTYALPPAPEPLPADEENVARPRRDEEMTLAEEPASPPAATNELPAETKRSNGAVRAPINEQQSEAGAIPLGSGN